MFYHMLLEWSYYCFNKIGVKGVGGGVGPWAKLGLVDGKEDRGRRPS